MSPIIKPFGFTFIPPLLVAICSSLLAAQSDQVVEYRGRVVKVADGDSITLLVEKQQVRIRLAEINTPELRQPYWRVSQIVKTKAAEALR